MKQTHWRVRKQENEKREWDQQTATFHLRVEFAAIMMRTAPQLTLYINHYSIKKRQIQRVQSVFTIFKLCHANNFSWCFFFEFIAIYANIIKRIFTFNQFFPYFFSLSIHYFFLTLSTWLRHSFELWQISLL